MQLIHVHLWPIPVHTTSKYRQHRFPKPLSANLSEFSTGFFRGPCYFSVVNHFRRLHWRENPATRPHDETVSLEVSPHIESDPVDFAHNRLHFDPDPIQTSVLRSTANRGMLNCTRQWGKSTVSAAKAVHRAFTRSGSVVLVASPTERQSAEFLRKASQMVSRLGIRPRGDGDNSTSLLFPNGSRIVGLPGTEATVRGFSAVSLILIDEASRVDDSLYNALRPMLAVGGGDMWLLSTPCGKRGFSYEAWAHGGDDGFAFLFPPRNAPAYPPNFLRMSAAPCPPTGSRRRYLAQFVDNGQSYFSRDKIEVAIDDPFDALVFE